MLTLGMQGRKWDIFVAAVDLFSARGYENVTMNDIAEANGMRSASIYNHYPSKQSILRQMYLFYSENALAEQSKLSGVLEAVPNADAKEILHSSVNKYDDGLRRMMDKICRISIMRSYQDEDAYNLVWKYNISLSKDFLRAVLRRMVEAGKIEPLDIDGFIDLLLSFSLTRVCRDLSPNPLGPDGWTRGLDMLFSVIKDK